MKKKWLAAMGMLVTFFLWTMAVRCVDVAPIGPDGSSVGFAALNGWFHRLTGVHMTLYIVTDWLGLVPVAVCCGFAVLGLCQWIHRRRITKVDGDILLLSAFYIITIAAYLLFESVVINYRPLLIEGRPEASYPSSTTLLTLSVMSTATMQWRRRLHHPTVRRAVTVAVAVFTAFMVLGRLCSGVHWLTDIIGGGLLGGGLTALYATACDWLNER